MATVGSLAISRLLRSGAAVLTRPKAPRTGVRFSSHQQYGIPGATLPFDLKNRYKLTFYFVLYFSSAFNLPFIVTAFQMIKKNV